ncbi:MAG: hypothetical protein ABEK59_03060 [Halobacteria archaeon]
MECKQGRTAVDVSLDQVSDENLNLGELEVTYTGEFQLQPSSTSDATTKSWSI